MLRIQVQAFEQVIQKLQQELADRRHVQTETEKLVDGLRKEVEQLRHDLRQQPQTGAGL